MATQKWIGASLNRKQVDFLTMSGTGDWVQNDTITLTIANIDFIITIGTLLTDAQVATTVYQALTGTTLTDTSASCTIPVADGGASLIPQFSEFTATNGTSGRVDLTANGTGALAGKPFTLTCAETSTGDDTAVRSSSIAPTSQYHADQADNFSGNAVLGAGDTFVLDAGSVDIRYALDLGVSLTQITKYKAYSGNVGLPPVNVDNSAKPYAEYRTPTYLTCTACTTADLEVGAGPGSGRFKLNTGTGASTLNIFGKGSRIETGVPCILWLGTNAANVVNNIAGDFGAAFYPGEVATIATLRTGDSTGQASTVCSSGVTLTTVVMNGGSLSTSSAITTATQNAGAWQHNTGTVTTGNILGGQCFPIGGATWTTLTIGSGGEFNTTKGTASFVITNTIQMYKGGKFIDPAGRAGNVVVKLNNCSLADVTIVLAPNKTYSLS